jgi:hypothetical protein
VVARYNDFLSTEAVLFQQGFALSRTPYGVMVVRAFFGKDSSKDYCGQAEKRKNVFF